MMRFPGDSLAVVSLVVILSGTACSTETSSTPEASGGAAASGGGSSGTGAAHASGGRGSGAEDGSSGSGGAIGSGGTAGSASSGGRSDASSGGTGPEPTGGAIGSGGGTGGGGASIAPSAGCESGSTIEGGRFTLDVDGTSREYILELPDDYDTSHPYRLIFGWHGRQYDAEWVANGEPPLTGPYFGIEAEAQGGAIFVAPQALESGWSNEAGRDIAFTEAMVNRLTSELCVDESRIFSTGFSFGAIMTITIGCELGDVFRAIAPMSGSLSGTCAGDRPLAYWASHGLDDTTIRPEQGEAARDVFVARNGCDPTAQPTDREGCVAFENCAVDSPVEWCTFTGAHVPAPFAGPAIWKFLSQF